MFVSAFRYVGLSHHTYARGFSYCQLLSLFSFFCPPSNSSAPSPGPRHLSIQTTITRPRPRQQRLNVAYLVDDHSGRLLRVCSPVLRLLPRPLHVQPRAAVVSSAEFFHNDAQTRTGACAALCCGNFSAPFMCSPVLRRRFLTQIKRMTFVPNMRLT